MGLGLYLTRRILTGEGGYIRVSSQPGEGQHLLPLSATGVTAPAAAPPLKSFSSVRFQKECGKDSFARMGIVNKGSAHFYP